MCPLKAETFWRIFCCNPIPVAIETIIIIIPNAMAVMAIFIIGADILLLWSLVVIRRFAIKYSNFKFWNYSWTKVKKVFATDYTDFYRLKNILCDI